MRLTQGHTGGCRSPHTLLRGLEAHPPMSYQGSPHTQVRSLRFLPTGSLFECTPPPGRTFENLFSIKIPCVPRFAEGVIAEHQ